MFLCRKQFFLIRLLWLVVALLPTTTLSAEVQVPSSVEAGRITKDIEKNSKRQSLEESTLKPGKKEKPQYNVSPFPIPEGADKVTLILHDLIIEGNTVFNPEDFRFIYQQYLYKQITLNKLYLWADEITKLYRDKGYFLSVAVVPNQEIKNNVARIKITEGYISEVAISEKKLSAQKLIKAYVDKLTNIRPIKVADLESFILSINDLYGYSFKSVLSPIENNNDGAVKLSLIVTKDKPHFKIGSDNYSSRYIGPHEVNALASIEFIPLQRTDLSILNSAFDNRLTYAAINHKFFIAPNYYVNLSYSYSKSHPGYLLTDQKINSESKSFATTIGYQIIRQRLENLDATIGFDAQNSNSDILFDPQTRDKTRTISGALAYNFYDKYNNYNYINLEVTKGIDVLGSSHEGDLHLSRATGDPKFIKAELSIARLQSINNYFSLLAMADAQLASNPLLSSQEFGYGGQNYGRAFDSSDITGDSGIKTSFQLNYKEIDYLSYAKLYPYIFYDIGLVTNRNTGQKKEESGASSGIGSKFELKKNISGNVALAWPLTRDRSSPIYGQSTNAPRLLLQMSSDF